jgi:hypothetical protein
LLTNLDIIAQSREPRREPGGSLADRRSPVQL